MAEAPDDTSRQQAEGGQIPILQELDQLPVAAVWYRLGLQLGVRADDLEVIEKDYPRDTKLCKVKMFNKWLSSDTNPNYEKLIKALAAVGKKSLAESVCDRQGISRTVLDAMEDVELPQSSEDDNFTAPDPKKRKLDVQLAAISFSDLEFGDKVGEGAFGVVYKGHWKSHDIDVAIKRVPGRIRTEILGQLRHPNIIQYHGVVVDRPGPPEHYIVTELAERGSLYDLLYKKNYKPSQEESLQWATQIAQGMEYLHQKKMMHRDLKSSNVLLTGDGNIKICDFGGAKCFDHTTKQTQAGTYRWMAPEVMEGKPVSLSADVFSYGMLLYEIFTCKLPFADAKSDLVVSGKIMRREIPSIPDSVKPCLAKLLKRCWDANPKARPSFHDILDILKKKTIVGEIVKPVDLLEAAKGTISAPTGDKRSIVLEGRRLRYTVERYIHHLKRKYRGKAWDEQTGINVTSSGWKSQGGAREHALEELVNKLVEQGVLTKAPPRNEL